MDPIIIDADHKDQKLLETNWLLWSILATVLCCQILGIVSIVFAALGNSVKDSNRELAIAHFKKSRLFFWIAVGSGIVVILGYIALIAAGELDEF